MWLSGLQLGEKKKPLYFHRDKVHAPKTPKCGFLNCLSTTMGYGFNQFGPDKHKRGTHGSKDNYCQEAACTKKGPYSKDRLAQHMYASHIRPLFRCDLDGCLSVVRAFKLDLLTHQAVFHGTNLSRFLSTCSVEEGTWGEIKRC